MKKVLLVIICMMLLVVVFFTGCGSISNSKEEILCKYRWISTDHNYGGRFIFQDNGNYEQSAPSMSGIHSSWRIEGSDLILGEDDVYTFKDISGSDSYDLEDDEWYVSNSILYLKGREYRGYDKE